jgi:hypothetical protein
MQSLVLAIRKFSIYNLSMPIPPLNFNDPLQLTLAADARFSRPSYTEDTIWKIRANQSQPPALSIFTTFGLRARAMQLFPAFYRANKALQNPEDFAQAPRIIRIFPNLISLSCAPYADIQASLDYWALSSDVLNGRISLINTGTDTIRLQVEWLALLNPLAQGAALQQATYKLQNILSGQVGERAVIVLGSNGPEPAHASFPGLAYELTLKPGGVSVLQWVCVIAASEESACEIGLQALSRPWDAEIARIELTNSSQSVSIATGRPDWDAALVFSQRAAASLFFGGSDALPRPSFVRSRQPEQGFSLLGSGKDYPAAWNGQTALDSWYLAGNLLPGQAERVQGLVENFIAVQEADGRIDWKPGLAGQRSQRLAQPLLASLAWQAYACTSDADWLRRIYPALAAFFKCWFSPDHDRDQDGFPEWDHPFQPGLDSMPLFNPGDRDSAGVEISTIESPSLAACLYHEAQALAQMAALLQLPADQYEFEQAQVRLNDGLNQAWEEARGVFVYQDYLSHSHQPGISLAEFNQTGTYPIKYSFKDPVRLLLKIQSDQEITRYCHFSIHGSGPEGTIREEVPARAIQWLHGSGRYTTRSTFTKVKEIIARQIQPGETIQFGSVPYDAEDLSNFLPLWAGMASQDQAAAMAAALHERYLSSYGLRLSPQAVPAGSQIHLPWNRMLIEGLIRYGQRDLAAKIMIANLNAVSLALTETKDFQAYYDAAHGLAESAESTQLSGAISTTTFLNCLGVELLAPNKLMIHGLSPFSLPVTVQYRGTVIEFFPDRTIIRTRLGNTFQIGDEEIHEIAL